MRDGTVSLQEVLTKITRDSRNKPPLSQMWSTMSRKLDFPRCKDIYIPHKFREYGRHYRENSFKFDKCIEGLMRCENDLVLVSAPPGMGKSRASEEIQFQLVVRMNSHFVIHQKLSRTIAYYNKAILDQMKPTVESFLNSCVDSRKEEYLQRQLEIEKVFLILDGIDEICPSHSEEVLKMIQDLIKSKVKLLVTSRPQEKDKILDGLKFAKIVTFQLDKFEDKENVQMLQNRLNLSKNECKSILKNFDKTIEGFTSNPLHLQMISDLYETERDKIFNIYQIYEKFLEKKLKHGLLTGAQMDQKSNNFAKEYYRLETALTKCAVSLLEQNRHTSPNIAGDNFVAINMSGVATIVKKNGPIDFVHKSYADFMVAKEILRLLFSSHEWETSKILEILCEESFQHIRKFVENGISQFCGQELNASSLDLIRKKWTQIMNFVCEEGLSEIYTHVIQNPFGTLQVADWLNISQQYEYHINGNGGLFVSACKHEKLAVKFANCCFTFNVRNVYQVVKFIAENTRSIIALEILLSKIEGWQENLLNTIDVEEVLSNVSFHSEQLELLIKGCPKILQIILETIYAQDFSAYTCRLDLLRVLLKNGLDLTFEKNGITLTNIFISQDNGACLLFEFANEVADHFKNAEYFDSEKSLIYRKNIGAKSPEELGIDFASERSRLGYYEHIVDCAKRLFDSGICYENSESTNGLKNVMSGQNYEVECLIWVNYLLQILRSKINWDEQDVFNFLQVENKVARDFKFKCGCSLAHAAVAVGNTTYFNMVIEKGFSMAEIDDKTGMSTLHVAVKNNREEMVKTLVEDHLVSPEIKDSEGQSALHLAISKDHLEIAEYLLEHGFDVNSQIESSRMTSLHLAVQNNNLAAVILLLDEGAQPDIQDSQGRTSLHCAVSQNNIELARLLIERNANPDLTDATNATPRILAAQSNIAEITELFTISVAGPSGLQDPEESIEDVAVIGWDEIKWQRMKRYLVHEHLNNLNLNLALHRFFTFPPDYDRRAGIQRKYLANSGFFFTFDYRSLQCYFCTFEITSLEGWKGLTLDEIHQRHIAESTQEFR